MQIFRAHHQWANRPDDERFSSLEELYRATKGYADQARELTVPDWDQLLVEPTEDNLYLRYIPDSLNVQDSPRLLLSHHAFGQLANRISAPAAYLRTLPTWLAAENINSGLTDRVEVGAKPVLLVHDLDDGERGVARAVNTERYTRIWNYEIAQRLMDMVYKFDLRPAVPTFNWNPNDPNLPGQNAPSLYASDHDMFAFLIDKERDVGNGLFRGIITWNSEVGGSSLGMMWFLFRDLCANHIIWQARDVSELRVAHRGNAKERFNEFTADVRTYLNSSTDDERNMVYTTTQLQLGTTKEEVLDKLFGNRRIGLARKVLDAAYDAVDVDQDGDPNTAWGFVQGLTRYSQTIPYADERTVLDRAGRNILQLASV